MSAKVEVIIHELKTDTEVFEATLRGDKTFEIRLNDRDFKRGDMLVLRETLYSGEQMKAGKPLEYTGRVLTRFVTYVLYGGYGLKTGWVMLGICENFLGWLFMSRMRPYNGECKKATEI